MITPERLQEITAPIFAEHGWEDTIVGFAAYKDLKAKWTRSYAWIEMSISDYLDDAPEDVVISLVDIICRRIRGHMADYPESVLAYLNSQGFRDVQRPRYLERLRGAHADMGLAEAVGKLRGEGVDIPEDLVVLAGPRNNASVLFRTIIVSEKLCGDQDVVCEVLRPMLEMISEGWTGGSK